MADALPETIAGVWQLCGVDDADDVVWKPNAPSRVPNPEDFALLFEGKPGLTSSYMRVGTNSIEAAYAMLLSISSLAGMKRYDRQELDEAVGRLVAEVLTQRLAAIVGASHPMAKVSVRLQSSASLVLHAEHLEEDGMLLGKTAFERDSPAVQLIAKSLEAALMSSDHPGLSPKDRHQWHLSHRSVTIVITGVVVLSVLAWLGRTNQVILVTCVVMIAVVGVVATVAGYGGKRKAHRYQLLSQTDSEESAADSGVPDMGDLLGPRHTRLLDELTESERKVAAKELANIVRDSAVPGSSLEVDLGRVGISARNPVLASMTMAALADITEVITAGWEVPTFGVQAIALRGCSVVFKTQSICVVQ